MSDRQFTNQQIEQWLYDAEFDWDTEDYDLPTPSNTFPWYYSDDYHPTLAAIFRELLELRAHKQLSDLAARQRHTRIRNELSIT